MCTRIGSNNAKWEEGKGEWQGVLERRRIYRWGTLDFTYIQSDRVVIGRIYICTRRVSLHSLPTTRWSRSIIITSRWNLSFAMTRKTKNETEGEEGRGKKGPTRAQTVAQRYGQEIAGRKFSVFRSTKKVWRQKGRRGSVRTATRFCDARGEASPCLLIARILSLRVVVAGPRSSLYNRQKRAHRYEIRFLHTLCANSAKL